MQNTLYSHINKTNGSNVQHTLCSSVTFEHDMKVLEQERSYLQACLEILQLKTQIVKAHNTFVAPVLA